MPVKVQTPNRPPEKVSWEDMEPNVLYIDKDGELGFKSGFAIDEAWVVVRNHSGTICVFLDGHNYEPYRKAPFGSRLTISNEG